MIPIQDLLHRIQWDSRFGKADFDIGYFDHVAGGIVHVPFRHVRFEKAEHFVFEAAEGMGAFTPFRFIAYVRSGAMAS
jgi:hypothetical protein